MSSTLGSCLCNGTWFVHCRPLFEARNGRVISRNDDILYNFTNPRNIIQAGTYRGFHRKNDGITASIPMKTTTSTIAIILLFSGQRFE